LFAQQDRKWQVPEIKQNFIVAPGIPPMGNRISA